MSIKEKLEGKKGYFEELFRLRKQRFDLQNGSDQRMCERVNKLDESGLFEIVEELIEIVPDSEANLTEKNDTLLLEYKGEFVNFRLKTWFVFDFELPTDKDVLSFTLRKDSLFMHKVGDDLYFPQKTEGQKQLSVLGKTIKNEIEFEVIDGLLKMGFPFENFDFSGFNLASQREALHG